MFENNKLKLLVAAAASAGAIYYYRYKKDHSNENREPPRDDFANLPEVRKLLEYVTKPVSIYVVKPDLETLPNAGMHTWYNNTTIIPQCNIHPVSNLLNLSTGTFDVKSVSRLSNRWRKSGIWTQFCDFIGLLNQSDLGQVLSAALIGGASAGIAWGLSSLVSLLSGAMSLGPLSIVAIGIFSALFFWTYVKAKKRQAEKASKIVCSLTREVLGLSIMFNTYDTYMRRLNDLVFKPNFNKYSKDVQTNLGRRLELARTCVREVELIQSWLREIGDYKPKDIIDNQSSIAEQLRNSSLRLIKHYLSELHYTNGLLTTNNEAKTEELDYTQLLAAYNTDTLRLPYLFNADRIEDWPDTVSHHKGFWLTPVPYGTSLVKVTEDATLHLSYGDATRYVVKKDVRPGVYHDISTNAEGNWDITTDTTIKIDSVLAHAWKEEEDQDRLTVKRLRRGEYRLVQRDMYFNPLLSPIYIECQSQPTIQTMNRSDVAADGQDIFRLIMPLGSDDEVKVQRLVPALLNLDSLQRQQATKLGLQINEPLDPLVISAIYQKYVTPGGSSLGVENLLRVFKPVKQFTINDYYHIVSTEIRELVNEVKSTGFFCFLEPTAKPQGYVMGEHAWSYNIDQDGTSYRGIGLPYLIVLTFIYQEGYGNYRIREKSRCVVYDVINLVTGKSMTVPNTGPINDSYKGKPHSFNFHYKAVVTDYRVQNLHINQSFYNPDPWVNLGSGSHLVKRNDLLHKGLKRFLYLRD